MAQDITLPIEDGYLNVRVGAIIIKNEKLLMVGNDREDYYYSVGGRVQFGESLEDAVRREVLEETGYALAIDRLGFVHEDFFYGDTPSKLGKPIHELAFYFYMKTPEAFEPRCRTLTEDGASEHLVWVSPDTDRTVYPAFFRTELKTPSPGIRHIVSDERNGNDSNKEA